MDASRKFDTCDRCEKKAHLQQIYCSKCNDSAYLCAKCSGVCFYCDSVEGLVEPKRIATRSSSRISVATESAFRADDKESPSKKQRLKKKASESKEEKLDAVKVVSRKHDSGKLKPRERSTDVKKRCSEKELSLDPCCETSREFIGREFNIGECSVMSLGRMIRALLTVFENRLGLISERPGVPGEALKCLAYDISFLWHNIAANLSHCIYERDFNTQFLIMEWRTERPKPHSVASCHPTAENLTNLLQSNKVQEKGWLGFTQSECDEMRPHQKNCTMLVRSLKESLRGIWWITHCGHSFCLVKRECTGGIEVIDSFANNRGLGFWALTPDELDAVAPLIPEDWKFHLPPKQHIWSVGEISRFMTMLVDDDFEVRYKAQLALVNYEYEVPTEEKDKDTLFEDQLPYGAFGFRQFELKPDEEIFLILAQKFFHAFYNWKNIRK